ncbi:MAG: PilZ domain-containing protein [Pseudomonadota bacterium]
MKTREIRSILGISPAMSRQIMPMIQRSNISLDVRRYPRKPVDLPATINGDPARTMDVSPEGVRLAASTELKPGSEVDVELMHRDGIRFRGKVRHVSMDTVGVHVMGMGREQKLLLLGLAG